MLLSPSLSPSPFDSPSTTTISPPPPPLPPLTPPEVVVQPPLPLLSPPSPPFQVTPHLSPTSTPPIPPPVLPVTSPPPAAVAISPVSIPSPPTTPPASSTITPIPITSPVSPPPPASVIIPSPLFPKSSSPPPPPQPSKPLPSTPPSVTLPPSRPPPEPSKPLPSTSPSVILPPPLTTPPSLPPPRPLPSVSPSPPAASHSIGSPNTTPTSSRAFPLSPPGASRSIGNPNTPGFFQAYPTPGPPPQPPLTSTIGKGGLPTTKQTPHSPIGLIVACIGVGILLFAIVFALVCICCKGRRRKVQKPLDSKKQVTKGDGFLAAPIVHKQENVAPSGAHVIELNPATLTADTTALNSSTDGIFTYEELVIATDGFSESNLLGQGGFGYVYKGILPSGQDVAVKKLKVGSRQGEREFQAEVETISRVHHKHLVSLVGYCINGPERLLVYEFVPNKTLEFHLHENGQPVIAWESRLKIAIGSAKGLAYLHEDCSPTIIHRDIKAANILLDKRFEAKVSDFGLAKIFLDASSSITHISTRVMGTFGYLAPEYALTGKLTDKSDVYSYGVMLLELITGRPPIIEQDSSTNQSLVDWARPLLPRALEDHDFDTLVDRRLNGSYNKSKMASMVSCAAACIRQSAWLRPRMIQVVRALEDDISLPYHDEGMRVSKSSSNASSDAFIRNAKRCINNGDQFSENYETTTSEYGI